MKLSEIEGQMKTLSTDVDELTTQADKLANEWRALCKKRMEKKKKITQLKNQREKIYFSVDISKYFDEGEEIFVDNPPKNNNKLSYSHYLKHVGEHVKIDSPIKIDEYNPKTIRIEYTNSSGHKYRKTISYTVFGKFIRDYTTHALKLKRGATLGDVLNI